MRHGHEEFPWLDAHSSFQFPPASQADNSGIVAVGGNLSPGMLISAYRQGIFPWFSEEDPIIWWSPNPRFVLFSDEIHVSRSMARILRSSPLRVSADENFCEVIRRCARVPRPGQDGTWITEDMQLAYRRLHELGFTHSVEVRRGENLVGGLYGVAIGRMFFGESMFSEEKNASKLALIHLARFLEMHGFDLIDAQQNTAHMESMGGRAIPREVFLDMVEARADLPPLPDRWTQMFSEYLSS